MDITRANFKEKLEEISQAITEASFLAIDCEFTGLSHEVSTHSLDSVEERYQKIKQGSSNFQLTQVGLCAFRYDSANKNYVAKAYNFYIFPRPFSRQAPDRRFLCQSSSLDFLATHGFDFNKWIYEGIPYLPLHEENKLKEALEQKHARFSDNSFMSPAFSSPASGQAGATVTKGPTQVPDDQKDFIESIKKRVENFLQEKQSEEESLCLETNISAFQRKLIYQTIQLKFRSSVHLETKVNDKKQRFIVVSRVQCEADRKKMEDARRQAEFDELDDAVGFSKVVKMVTQSGKLIVGHNMVLDTVHILNHFSCPIPEDYSDFKQILKCVFPNLLDTKVMATSQPIKEYVISSALGDLQKTVELKPFVKPGIVVAEGFEKYSTSGEPLHEAGYDAYITGLCFIGMSNFLGTFQTPQKAHIPPNSPLITPFLNKLFLFKMLDVPYMNLTGPDLQPNRDHVFHITFPSEWKMSDLFMLFNPFGNIQIVWIDDTSAYISLYKREEAPSVLKQLNKGQGDTYKIMTFNDFKRNSTASRKRPRTPESDVDLPSKKNKPLNVQASPFQSRYSITPIPEEENEDGQDSKNGSDEAMKTQDESAESSGKKDKMFEEPDTW